MPFGVKPVCNKCKDTCALLWKKGHDGEVICNSCNTTKRNSDNGGDGVSDSDYGKQQYKVSTGQQMSSNSNGPVRKSARLKPTKYKGQYNHKTLATKGKNRRVIFKKNPIKAPFPVATVLTLEHIFYNGLYWQTGDIVSVMDHDGGIYYAQIRCFLQDQYCQKSAVITWLIPTVETKKDSFDPATYILGPEEDLPRSMEAFEFVCHAPSEYFKSRNGPYETNSYKSNLAYVSTLSGSEIQPIPSQEEIFGINDAEMKLVVPRGAGRGKGRGVRKSVKTEKIIKQEPEIKTEIKEEPL